jgi:hypothetical protein
MANYHTYVPTSSQQGISGSPTTILQLKFPHERGEPPMISQLGMNSDNRDSASAAQTGYNLSPYADTATTPSPPSLIASPDGPDTPSTRPLSDSPDLVHSPSNEPRKARREKPRIELAPDQPPTTQGRPRARVFVACLQWCASFSLSKRLPVPFSYFSL